MKRLLLFLTLSLCINLHTKAQVSQAERDALIDLFNATNGNEWTNNTNWLSGSEPVSSWYGVTVENNMVTEVSLYSNNLEGSLPNSIINLSNVGTLYFANNKLDGSLPDFSVMSNLVFLYINNNNYDFLD